MYMTSFKPRPSPFTATPQEKGDAQKGQVPQAATQPDAPLLSSLVFSGVESSRCLSLSPGKDYRFSVVCNTRRLHCFPVLGTGLPGLGPEHLPGAPCSGTGSPALARLSNFTFTFHFHALEKEMATHSSILAWRIPGMGK